MADMAHLHDHEHASGVQLSSDAWQLHPYIANPPSKPNQFMLWQPNKNYSNTSTNS
jgi:hypothetical protein